MTLLIDPPETTANLDELESDIESTPETESLSKPFRLGIIGIGAAIGLFTRLSAANGFGDLNSRPLMFAAALTSAVLGIGLALTAAERVRFGAPLIWMTTITGLAWGVLNWVSPPFDESVTVWSNADQLVLAVLGVGNGLLLAGLVALAFVRRGPTLSVAATLLAGVAALLSNTVLLREEWPAIITLGVGFFLILLAWDRSPRSEPTFVVPEEAPRVSRAALGFISVALCGTALQVWISRTDTPRSWPAVGLGVILIAGAFASMIRVRREIERRETTLSEWTSWMREIRTNDFRSEIETFDSTTEPVEPVTFDPRPPVGVDGEAPRKLSFPNLTVAGAPDAVPETDLAMPESFAAEPTPDSVTDDAVPDDSVTDDAVPGDAVPGDGVALSPEAVPEPVAELLLEIDLPSAAAVIKPEPAAVLPLGIAPTVDPELGSTQAPQPALPAAPVAAPLFVASNVASLFPAPDTAPVELPDPAQSPLPPADVGAEPAPTRVPEPSTGALTDLDTALVYREPGEPDFGELSDLDASLAALAQPDQAPRAPFRPQAAPIAPPTVPRVNLGSTSSAAPKPAAPKLARPQPAAPKPAAPKPLGAFSSMIAAPDDQAETTPRIADLAALSQWLGSAAVATSEDPLLVAVEAMSLDEFESLPPEDAAMARDEIGKYLSETMPEADVVSWIDGPYFIIAIASKPDRELRRLNAAVQSLLRATHGTHAFLRPGVDPSIDDVVNEAVSGILQARRREASING